MAKGLENLKVYKLAYSFKNDVYEIAAKFPKEEKYRLTDQIKRSASSITANIAESYGKFNYKEKIHSLYIARAEALETKNHLIDALDKKLLNQIDYQRISNLYTNLAKTTNGYIRFLKSKIAPN